jgi:hypothetical protein
MGRLVADVNDGYSRLMIFNYTKQLVDTRIQAIPSRGAQVIMDTGIHAPMENMINDDDIVQTLEFGESPDGVLQIFRASTDNLHDVRLSIKGEGGATTFDNMEYATDGAAQAEWVASDATNTQVYSEDTIVYQGSYSLKIHCDKKDSPGDTVTKTFSAEDWTGYESIRFWRYNTVGNGHCVWNVEISDDGTDWLSSQFTSLLANTWEELVIPIDNMTGSGVDLSSITRVRFKMVECTAVHYFYIDQFELLADVGTAFLRLYDFGTTSEPTSLTDGTQLTFDGGDTQLQITLPLNKSIVNIHAHRGAHVRDDNNLTVGNYYGIWIDGLTSGKLHLYGSDSQLYNSGKMYTLDGNDVTETSKSLRFLNFSVVESVLLSCKFNFDASPGDSVIYMPCRDITNNNLMDTFVGTIYCWDETEISADYSKADIPLYYNADCPFRPIYSDDENTSQATEIKTTVQWAYKPVETYG